MTLAVTDDVFEAHRGTVFGVAYRMLGSIADAEDVVSDTWLRWHGRDQRRTVTEPRAYLLTVATRLALDELRSARRRRVDYVGPWLPEPLVAAWDDPADVAETRDTLSLGFMRLLEQLTPTERAVYVLREAFDLPHRDIADILSVNEANVRQHHRRARLRLGRDASPRFRPDREKCAELVHRFLVASSTGDVEPLAELLAEDAVLYGDGGGKASSIRRPASGRLRIARFIRGLVRHSPEGLAVTPVWANGEPAILLRSGGEAIGVYAFTLDGDGETVTAIHAVRNPDKLAHLR